MNVDHTTAEALLRDIELTHPPYGTVAIWYIGQESVVIKGSDSVIYVDPFVSDELEKVHGVKRRYPPPFTPEQLRLVDYCFITHEHEDHLDPGTIRVLAQRSPSTEYAAPGICRPQLEQLGVRPEMILDAVTDRWVEARGFRWKAVPAAHEALEYDPKTGSRYVGYLFDINGVLVYHAGDTVIYPDLVQRLREERIDIALLPINGRDAFRNQVGIVGNMNYREAAELAVRAQIDTVVPLHYDMFEMNSEHPGYFVDYVYSRYPHQKCHVMSRFERFVYVPPRAFRT